MSSSIKAPMRARSSSTVSTTSPTLVSTKSFQKTIALSSKTSTAPTTVNQNQAPHIQAQTQGQAATLRTPKPRRPSLPILPASQAQPSQKPSATTHLQPTKDIQTLRSQRSLPRLNQVVKNGNGSGNEITLLPSHIARPTTTLSSPRSYSSSSPRLGSSASRFGDSLQQRPASALSHSNNSSTSCSTPSLIAKPVSRTQKSATVKPLSIVTKPNSPGTATTMSASMSNASQTSNSSGSSSSSSCGSASARSFSLPPIAPSPNTASVQTPLSTTSTTTSSSLSASSPLIGSHCNSLPTLTSIAAATAVVTASATTTKVRSKNRLNAGIDSACYMTRSSSGESLASSSASSSPVSTPVMTAVSTMATTTTTPSSATATLLSSTPTNKIRKRISRRPSAADLTPVTSPSVRSRPSTPSPKATISKITGTRLTSPLSNVDSTASEGVTQSNIPPIPATIIVKCTCPPPIKFPENVKQEMKREEEEHRKRECGLYEKIIELQIENANLQSEKETLNRVLSRRDKMLLELQMQLQAMEFVCRENDIKVDIDMCPDEAIENWSFKESDEVYQRILLTTQDLLRTGSKCLEENMVASRSSSQHQRRSRHSSMTNSSTASTTRSSVGSIVAGGVNLSMFEDGIASRRNLAAGLSEDTQPLATQDQEVNPLLFKETSRPGTLKLDLQTLLRSEQESNSNIGIECGGRRAIDCGEDRSSFFRDVANQSPDSQRENGLGISSADDDDEIDDDDDEDEESEFEELGEDMIKFSDLQSSVAPRRESRASSFSMLLPPGGCHSGATTPDLSSAVLMKNMWSANGSARRSACNTPLYHPAFQHIGQQQQQHNYSQYSHSHRRSINRSSGGSSLSSSSLLEDYFSRPQLTSSQDQGASIGLGLGLTALSRSPEQLATERFPSSLPRDAPPLQPLPPLPMSTPLPHSRSSSPRAHPFSTSPLNHDIISSFPPVPSSHHQLHHHINHSSTTHYNNNNTIHPPPTTPLPPLPERPRYSYRDHTKIQLLQSKKPFHGRTCSHGFAIENVAEFLKRRTFGKTLTRDTMNRGLRRRNSV
ncbi:hypothetical protein FBU30_007894 [Linnemannia zychae]|nr:hypothetical protein FBU30_007894 [Linnemannia zychae]